MTRALKWWAIGLALSGAAWVGALAHQAWGGIGVVMFLGALAFWAFVIWTLAMNRKGRKR